MCYFFSCPPFTFRIAGVQPLESSCQAFDNFSSISESIWSSKGLTRRRRSIPGGSLSLRPQFIHFLMKRAEVVICIDLKCLLFSGTECIPSDSVENICDVFNRYISLAL